MAKAPAKSSKKKSFKKKEKKSVPTGLVHIQATFNNTIVTITDPVGNVIAWSSAGSLGYRGSRKGTPFAAQQAALTAANKAKESGLCAVSIRNSNHFGIAGFYSMMALEKDMIGISLTNSQPLVAPTYGKTAVLGTNPISVAVPSGKEFPYVLDMATRQHRRGLCSCGTPRVH